MKTMHFFRKGLMIILFVFAFLVPISFIVMALWNNVLVPVLHVTLINFWQALGIFALSKILFGGFPGRGGRGRQWNRHWNGDMGGMRGKWMNMTPEEKENFKKDWRNRCDPRQRRDAAPAAE